MNISKYLRFSLIAVMAFSFTSCEKDDDNDDTPPGSTNEEELITDLVLTFTNTDDQSQVTFMFSDPDGPGGDPPAVDDIFIDDSTSYSVSVEVLDASDPNDVEDITTEIMDEDEAHQFFYIAESADNSIDISYDIFDVDGNGNPVGLSTIWNTNEPTADNGTVRIVLRHELNKDATGIAIDDFAGSGGETDIDVTFNLTIVD
ncbi:hypothetical protein O3Q51_10530 [Cryomorphaceae bacterium 1068]|nr:hypothetical protein [Cryomorphaceae bacterium 1068]